MKSTSGQDPEAQYKLERDNFKGFKDIVIAVDSSEDAKRAVEWTMENLCSKGTAVHLLNILVDDTYSSVPLGVSIDQSEQPQVIVSMDSEITDYDRLQTHIQRGEDQMKSQLIEIYGPLIAKSFNRVEVVVHTHEGARSAATIGEKVMQIATDLEAELLVVATHGSALFCEYGSVAKHCCANFTKPNLLIPPKITMASEPTDLSETQRPSVVLVAQTKEELESMAEWLSKVHIIKPGYNVHVYYLQRTDDTPSEKQIEEYLRRVKNTPDLQITVTKDIQPRPSPKESADHHEEFGQLIEMFDTLKPRFAVLCQRINQDLFHEINYGEMSKFCIRNISQPLLVLNSDKTLP